MLYLDTDVVVMANLDELWSNEIEPHPDALFHWGGSLTSAFVVMEPPLDPPRISSKGTLEGGSKLDRDEGWSCLSQQPSTTV